MHRILLATAVLFSASAFAIEVEKYAEGPLAGKGYPFSESVRVGDVLLLSGQIGSDASGNLVEGGIAQEADQTLKNIAATLERRGLSMSDVVKCTVFLADIGEWGAFNEVYKKHFQAPFPARSALGASGLALNARVEVECVAAYPDS